MQSIKSLENQYAGEDIYVIGAGKSGDFIDPEFLKDRIAIGVNQSHRRFKHLKYIIKKDGVSAEDLATGIPTIVSAYECGSFIDKKNNGDYFFSHDINKHINISINNLHPDGDHIIVSYSTITSAMHIAAFMGAKTIFLIGHDCRAVDGESSFRGYHTGVPTLWKSMDGYTAWLSEIEPQSTMTKAYIKQAYDCKVYSINPFVSLRFEGHELGK